MDNILVLLFVWFCSANGQQSGQPPTSQPAGSDNSAPRFSIGLGVLSPSYSQKFGDDGKIKLDYNAPNEKGAFSYSVSNLVHPVIKHSESATNDKGLAPQPKHETQSHFSPSLPPVSAHHGNQNHGSKPDFAGLGGGYFAPLNAPSHSSPSPVPTNNYPSNVYNGGVNNHQQQQQQHNYGGNGGAQSGVVPQSQTGQYFHSYDPGLYQTGAYNHNPSAYGSTTHNSAPQQVQQPLHQHQSPSIGQNQYLGQSANTNGYGQHGYYPQSGAHGQHSNRNNGLYGSGSQHGSSLTPYNNDNNNANYGSHQGYQSYGGLSPEAVNAFRQIYASGSDNYLNYVDPYAAMYGQSPYTINNAMPVSNLGSYAGLRSMAYGGYNGLRTLLG